MKVEGWFICDDSLILGYRGGEERLLNRTKRGVPSGANYYGTEGEARRDLALMRSCGSWPLFTDGARVEKIAW